MTSVDPELVTTYVPRLVRGDEAYHGPGPHLVEGTLLVADVSGFTRLTEKLSRRSKAGAEEIVRTISTVFTALLAAAPGDGDVLKFSGDALLILYTGRDHARRACTDALVMRTTLQRVGGIDSSCGRVRLRMSIGIQTGAFHAFVCGGDHLELLLHGPDASAAVGFQAAAGPGCIVVGGATATAADVPTSAHQSGGRLLGAPRRRVATDPTAGGGAHADVASPGTRGLERFLAPPLRGRLDALDQAHEHRRTTIAFVRFGGVDALLRHGDPDVAFERVQALVAGAMAAAAEFGVLLTATDVDVGGGVLMLTAGAPDTTGDDEARMLRVALAVRDVDAGLPVRCGVNSGDVFVGAVGAPTRRTYSTMGAATNLAARVSAHAEPGQVLATDAVLAVAGRRFAVDPVPPFAVRGSRREVGAAVVRAPAAPATATVTDSAPLIGRDDERAILAAALAAVESGVGRVVEIVGATGSGRSRLVAEARRLVPPERPWVEITCDPHDRASPYHAARRLLRPLLGIPPDADGGAAAAALAELVAGSRPDLEPYLPLLAGPLGAAVAATPESGDVGLAHRRVRTQELVCELLSAAAPPGPVVLVCEDATGMDDASAELLATVLTRVVVARPWLAIVTREPVAAGLHVERGYTADVVALGPLEDAAMTRLAQRLAESDPVPSHRLPDLVARAAGSPLVLAELIAAQAGGADELPRSVEGVIAARIDQLDAGHRTRLRELAVLGDRFPVALAATVLDGDGTWVPQDGVDGFVEHDGDDLVFRSRLVRQVAYEGLPFHRRHELHRRVADRLLASPDRRPAELAHHLARARRWREVWTVARDAATRAEGEAANAEAAELYALALEAAQHTALPAAAIAETATRAGDAADRAGLYDVAERAYGRAAASSADPVDRLLLDLRRARVHEHAGRFAAALRAYRRVLTTGERLTGERPTGDAGDLTRCVARAHAGYAATRLRQGRPREAVEQAESAAAAARVADDDESLAHAYHVLASAHAALGDRAAATHYRDLAIPAFARLGDLAAQGTVLFDLGVDAQRRDQLEEARWFLEQSHGVRQRAGDVVNAAASANALGEVLLALGERDDARARFTEALRSWRGARVADGVATAATHLGRMALEDGDLDEAIRRLGEAAELAARAGAGAALVAAHGGLAEALCRAGRVVEAWEVAGRVLAAEASPAAVAAAHRVRADALRRTGGHERAAEEEALAAGLAG